MNVISRLAASVKPGRVAPALLMWMTALGVSGLILSAPAAETNVAKEMPGRYLLIVDTSSAMDRSAENMQKLVGNLVASGLNGQMRAGETLGLWTYDEELHAGKFPVERWTPQTGQRLASAVYEFLHRHPYKKKSRFERVLEPLTGVIKDSDKITVVLVSAGDRQIKGTPYDGEVNESFKLNYEAQRKQRLPFITVFRARKGEFVGSKVNTPPFPVEFPKFPVEPLPAKTTAVIAEPKTKPAAKTNEPAPAAVSAKAEPPPATAPAKTPSPSPISPPIAPTTESRKPEPPVTATAKTETKPAEANVVPAQTQPVVEPPSVKPEKLVTPSPPEPGVPTTPLTGLKQPEATPFTGANVTTKPQETPTAPPTSPIGGAKPPAASTQPPATVAASIPEPIRTESTPKESGPPTASAPASATTSPAVQTAVAVPPQTLFNRRNILIVGGALLLLALGIVVLLARRPRPPERISLITRSMDRDQE